jgi:hypothetical protein
MALTSPLPFEECLRDFLSTDTPERRNKVRAAIGIAADTTGDWFLRGAKPRGIQRLRALYFLEDMGYRVLEIGQLRPVVADAGRLCAYGISTVQGMATVFGYTAETGVEQMFEVLRGNVIPPEMRLDSARVFVDSHRSRLDEERAKRQRHRTDNGKIQPKTEEPNANKAFIIGLSASIAAPLLQLTDFLLSDECSDADRDAFRNSVDVFGLSTNFNRLCSETMLREMQDRIKVTSGKVTIAGKVKKR